MAAAAGRGQLEPFNVCRETREKPSTPGFSAGVPPDEDTLRAKASEGVGNADGAKTRCGHPSRYQFFFRFILITHGMSGGN